ncbi:acetyl esterase [Candidatus Methanoplasma termitum]|uniref:Aes2 protein n=1 Tax=Candidatus Methanoplasma termitum TaxID=1577791 RepID=A0A0A7LAU8_9ARCH|nr:alpha/beta hydrolase [Candidatus Methanoplasma termitum]AIZ56199.1 acetyl esterase [Candidatus Methanoplasma termitum]
MDKEQAAQLMKKMRDEFNKSRFVSTVAKERYVDTSYGKIRVLEYGFDSDKVKPLYVDIHGGGYCVGFPEMDEEINLFIKSKVDVKIISIDWPKAPENPYPIGLEATYQVVKHYADNAKKYKIDKENIGTGGYSSGGNFATVIPIKARERGDFKIKYHMICVPGVDISGDPYDKPGSDKILTGQTLEAIYLCYLPEPKYGKEPYASPRIAPKEMLRGQPPMLLIAAGRDPLYPQYIDYAAKLKEAGVDVEVFDSKNSDHDFFYNHNEESAKAKEVLVKFLKKHTKA